MEEHGPDHAVLGLDSPDGDQGFPGALSVRARYAVDDTTVSVQLSAVSDTATVVNLTSHVYLNLDGDGAGTVDDHELEVLADFYTPVDGTGVPLGDHTPVAGTAFDARRPRRIGDMVRTGDEQVVAARGIDHNYVVRGWSPGAGLRPVAVLSSPHSATQVELASDQPGLQVYTGNFLDGTRHDRAGGLYRQGDGIALEPQRHPDSPNHPDGPAWPSARVDAGAMYSTSIRWRFSAR